ncbi:MAG: TonB-dependent receptor [Candidatus Thiodiazotropha endolucinida]
MKRFTIPLLVPTGISLFLSISVLAEETQLASIVVSASRTIQANPPSSSVISIITREEIERSAAHNLLQLLSGHSGIQLTSLYGDGSKATIDMRGFGPSAGANTLILVDGRRLNNSGDRAAPDLNSIDLRRVERIEIVQGSAGTLYGNQAVGGMVNIITRRADAFSAKLAAGAGSYDGYDLYADLGNRLENGLAYHLSARHRESDNYRENNQTEREDYNLRLDYRHPQGEVFLEHQRVDDYQQLPGSLFEAEMEQDRRQSIAAYSGDFSDLESDISRIGLQQELGGYWSFEGEVTRRDDQRSFQTSFRTTPDSVSTQDREVLGFNPRLIAIFPFAAGEATFTGGADLERTDYALQTSFGPQLLDQSVNAYYLQLTAPITGWASTTVGYRHAEVENEIDSGSGVDRLDDSVSAAALGFNFTPAEDLRLFVRLDQNYRFATVDEHTNVLFGQPVGIENQTGTSYEAGLEWSRPELRTLLLLYRLDLEDEISFDATGFVNTNLDETRRKGVTLESSWRAYPTLTLGGSLSYTDPTITDGAFKGNRIPLVAARSARLSGDWRFSPQWSLVGETVFTSERIVGGDFSNALARLPGFGVTNVSAHYRHGPWHLSLRIDNLFDKEYANSGSAGFDASFNQQAAFFPAPERNLWLALSYQFE